jgi:uncharacterized protein YceK
VHDGLLAAVKLAAVAAALVVVGTLAGCSSIPTHTSATALKSDLEQARTAVLKYLSAQTGDTSIHPTVASLKKYGFTPSKDTRDFKYFSNSAGVRFCIQATTPQGATFKVYIENDSKFSNVVAGACIAGTDF